MIWNGFEGMSIAFENESDDKVVSSVARPVVSRFHFCATQFETIKMKLNQWYFAQSLFIALMDINYQIKSVT